MEIICLDTDVLIAHKRAKTVAKPRTLLYRLASQSYRFAVSVITTYELLRGDNQNEDQYWKTMFDNMQILPFDYGCSEQAANLYKTLKQQGLLIETEDLLIAATALRYHLKLATGNLKHFSRIAGLVLVESDI